ncbi:hypothetical protein [Nodularia harveyana]|uniref:hypothetical protein n=1 Tax=Nodularia harveyana TaxID=114805 RepID=UPI002B2084F7|nr:hypothetical protein [Nodularia harveyana]
MLCQTVGIILLCDRTNFFEQPYQFKDLVNSTPFFGLILNPSDTQPSQQKSSNTFYKLLTRRKQVFET